jgi:hypothetical protein
MSRMGDYIIGLQEAGYDISDVPEFTGGWDQHKVIFKANPFIACPECKGSDRVGQIEHEKFKLTGTGIYEPHAHWVECDNCNGLGEIQSDIEENDNE